MRIESIVARWALSWSCRTHGFIYPHENVKKKLIRFTEKINILYYHCIFSNLGLTFEARKQKHCDFFGKQKRSVKINVNDSYAI